MYSEHQKHHILYPFPSQIYMAHIAISMTITDGYAVLAQARDARPPWPPKKWLPQPSSPRKIFNSASPHPAMKKR